MRFTENNWVELVVYAVGIALFVVIGYAVSAYQCQAQWGHSGMIPRFGISSGCQLERPDGTRIPASAFREVP